MRNTIFICGFVLLLIPWHAAADADRALSNLDPLVQLLAQVDDPAVQLDVLRGIHQSIEGRRTVTLPKGWPAVSRKLAKSPNAEVRETARLLSVIFGDLQAMSALRKTVMDRTAKVDARRKALRALVQKKDPKLLPRLKQFVSSGTSREMRGPALRGLAAYGDPGTPKLVLRHYSSFNDLEKQDAIYTLASRPSYASELLDAIEKGGVPSRDVSAFTVRQVLGFNNKQINRRLNQVWGTIRPTDKDKAALIAQYKAKLTPKHLKNADKSQGRLVFSRTCAACHKLFGAGRKVGPDLTGSQRANLDYILQNLLDPNAVIGRDFQMTVIVTTAGRVITGIIAQENNSTITVQTANDDVIVPKDEIDVRKRSPVSMMPEGMLGKLKSAEVRDLVAYLASPGQVPLPKQSE